MDNARLVANWHRQIIHTCESRLRRKLTPKEERFIRSRGGFIALEFIETTVAAASAEELEAYLNSESG